MGSIIAESAIGKPSIPVPGRVISTRSFGESTRADCALFMGNDLDSPVVLLAKYFLNWKLLSCVSVRSIPVVLLSLMEDQLNLRN